MPNRLIRETSPYLQQHAGNPVDWYPWGERALALAREQDKPILLSIGYSTCHWCHVMAHESFEDEATAELINRYFVAIKVDREERPDLDQIYQSAHALLTGRSGGWPLTLFLTPDQTPFFGGTYFPPQARYNLPGFKDLLDQRAFAVILGTGYPTYNLSHFVARDYWEAARSGVETGKPGATGWLGRYLDFAFKGDKDAKLSLSVGPYRSPLVITGAEHPGIGFSSPDSFRFAGERSAKGRALPLAPTGFPAHGVSSRTGVPASGEADQRRVQTASLVARLYGARSTLRRIRPRSSSH